MSIRLQQTFSGGCAGKCPRGLVEDVIEICQGYGHEIEWSDCNRIPEMEGELIQSVDVINQIVPDPKTFGRIAAAHACSDIYVSGGKPVICNMILGVPRHTPHDNVMEAVRGAAAHMSDQGVQIRGGHTIHSECLQLGFSVIGHRPRLMTKGPILKGDLLLLTKPIGTGLMASSFHSGVDSTNWEGELLEVLKEPNYVGIALCNHPSVKAVTDITGFGLAFGIEQLCGLQAHATIWFESIPVFPDWERFALEGYYPSLAYRNKEMMSFENEDRISDWRELLLYDPQTNGSTLSIVSCDALSSLSEELAASGSHLHVIGRIGGDVHRLKEVQNGD